MGLINVVQINYMASYVTEFQTWGAGLGSSILTASARRAWDAWVRDWVMANNWCVRSGGYAPHRFHALFSQYRSVPQWIGD